MAASKFQKPNGFELWQTGGGCTAWGKTYENGCYAMITGENELKEPTDESTGAYLVTYDTEGEPIDESICSNNKQLKGLVEISEEIYG